AQAINQRFLNNAAGRPNTGNAVRLPGVNGPSLRSCGGGAATGGKSGPARTPFSRRIYCILQ
ncbi:MAG: hypothetical protein FWF13_05290, partial [Acidobacteria bacterium]|nr:hypothetical protein [Acidobacteriota bacterium]